MSDPLYAFPTVGEQTLRALARYPSRTAFSWPGGSITYRSATDLIGRIQSVFMRLELLPGVLAKSASSPIPHPLSSAQPMAGCHLAKRVLGQAG